MHKSTSERFWSKVDRKSDKECWEYKKSKNQKGYGRFKLSGKLMGAHRMAYILSHNHSIPDDLQVLHFCDNPSCCNPLHLFLGTNADNMRDKAMKGRVRHGDSVTMATCNACLSAKDILAIRELKIPISGCLKKYKYSPISIAKIFRMSIKTTQRVWASETYPCKEGYLV